MAGLVERLARLFARPPEHYPGADRRGAIRDEQVEAVLRQVGELKQTLEKFEESLGEARTTGKDAW